MNTTTLQNTGDHTGGVDQWDVTHPSLRQCMQLQGCSTAGGTAVRGGGNEGPHGSQPSCTHKRLDLPPLGSELQLEVPRKKPLLPFATA
jgi:hypothetical protein